MTTACAAALVSAAALVGIAGCGQQVEGTAIAADPGAGVHTTATRGAEPTTSGPTTSASTTSGPPPSWTAQPEPSGGVITATAPPGVTLVDPPASESQAVTAETCATYNRLEPRIDEVTSNSSSASAEELRSLANDLNAAAADMPPSSVRAHLLNGATYANVAADNTPSDPEAARNARVMMVDSLLALMFVCLFAN